MTGDDSPGPTAVFQRTFWLGPKLTGGLPSPIPEEFGPLNCGHHTLPLFCAAPAKLEKANTARIVVQETRVILDSCLRFIGKIDRDRYPLENCSDEYIE
jgi:hypothetical protein